MFYHIFDNKSLNFITGEIPEPDFEVLIDETNKVVYPGQDAQLTCSARTQKEISSIEWTRQGGVLPEGQYRGCSVPQ